MKKILLIVCLVCAASLTKADVIADWTFETTPPTTSGNYAADNGVFASASSASGSHAGAAVYSSPAGPQSAHSYSSTLWAVGDYYQFKTSTLGYSGIGITFEATSSTTGPKDFKLQYSIDGTSFSDFASYSVQVNGSPNTAWNASLSASAAAVYDLSFNLSSDVDNQSTVYFRLTDVDTTSEGGNGGVVATTGTSRVDDFLINGSLAPVPEPATWGAISGFGLLGLCGFRTWRQNRAAKIAAV